MHPIQQSQRPPGGRVDAKVRQKSFSFVLQTFVICDNNLSIDGLIQVLDGLDSHDNLTDGEDITVGVVRAR